MPSHDMSQAVDKAVCGEQSFRFIEVVQDVQGQVLVQHPVETICERVGFEKVCQIVLLLNGTLEVGLEDPYLFESDTVF